VVCLLLPQELCLVVYHLACPPHPSFQSSRVDSTTSSISTLSLRVKNISPSVNSYACEIILFVVRSFGLHSLVNSPHERLAAWAELAVDTFNDLLVLMLKL
jgi:hypothetical protein